MPTHQDDRDVRIIWQKFKRSYDLKNGSISTYEIIERNGKLEIVSNKILTKE